MDENKMRENKSTMRNDMSERCSLLNFLSKYQFSFLPNSHAVNNSETHLIPQILLFYVYSTISLSPNTSHEQKICTAPQESNTPKKLEENSGNFQETWWPKKHQKKAKVKTHANIATWGD
ncbi:13185_t:CDS:2 [Ambispora leptoticha]|uniref:13185_t:CDS:1 n=1 Tax=Ambispora leptoticha TaxID=144679 RepID=A0A9N8YXS4_9GLOM|nr:13185_t:CDS:2 [Ambispora leptoticha]